MGPPTELSLFSGAGGGLLASRWILGWRTVCYVERDRWCQRVLGARIADGLLDDAPLWDDVRTFDGRPWRGLVDVVSAGFPCQPFSVAGRRAAADDERNGWPDTVRIIREVRPALAWLENVPGLLAASHGYFGEVLGSLAESGYDAVWDCVSAAACGAPHLRDRLWVLATDSRRDDLRELAERAERHRRALRASVGGEAVARDDGEAWLVADADGGRREGERLAEPRRERGACGREPDRRRRFGRLLDAEGWRDWPAEPEVGRVAHGVADRVGQLRALGNGQVPRVAALAWRLLRW